MSAVLMNERNLNRVFNRLGVPRGLSKRHAKRARENLKRRSKNKGEENTKAPWLRDIFLDALGGENKSNLKIATKAANNIANSTVFYGRLRDIMSWDMVAFLDSSAVLRSMAHTFSGYLFDSGNLRRLDPALDAARYSGEYPTASLLIDEFRFGKMQDTKDLKVNGILIENADQAKAIYQALDKTDSKLGKQFAHHLAHEMEEGNTWGKISRNQAKVAEIERSKEQGLRANQKRILMGG